MSVRCSSEEQELKEDTARDHRIKCWEECSSGVSLLDGWTILPVTAGLTSGRKISLETVGAQNTGSATAGIQATGGRLTRKDESYHGCDSMWRKNIMCAMAGILVTGIQLVGVKRTIVTTISAHRRGESTTTFTGVEVNPGESLAYTAAQSWIIVLRPFRKVEEALLYKFGLKPRVIQRNSQAVGIGGKAKVLGKVLVWEVSTVL